MGNEVSYRAVREYAVPHHSVTCSLGIQQWLSFERDVQYFVIEYAVLVGIIDHLVPDASERYENADAQLVHLGLTG